MFFILSSLSVQSQSTSPKKVTNQEISAMIAKFKIDQRGPYRDIRWFCLDGSFVLPQERCPEIGGVQRARYKPIVEALAKSNHIFLGQILSETYNKAFWCS